MNKTLFVHKLHSLFSIEFSIMKQSCKAPNKHPPPHMTVTNKYYISEV